MSIALVGIPFDHGVALNKGRPGARLAPQAIRKYLSKQFYDAGDIKPVPKDVRRTHTKVTRQLTKLLKEHDAVISLGGGHDLSYATVRALHTVYKKVGGINYDAHFDVREVVNGRISSGTPFRRLIEDKLVAGKQFVELGLHAPTNLYHHYLFLANNHASLFRLPEIKKKGIQALTKKSLNIAGKRTNAVFVDIDIDAIQKKYAPGCSAPNEQGFTAQEMRTAAYLAGLNKKVKLFNLMEVNPKFDVANKTAKLAAQLVEQFVRGRG